MGRKIAVMGNSCTGKTTLAGRLAERLGVPHVELDALHHGPDWQEATADELRVRVEAALAGLDGWVVDGNYLSKLGRRIVDAADTVIWLDLPLHTCLARMWRRTTSRIHDGVELWDTGNRETWRNFVFKWNGLLLYELRTYRRRRRQIRQLPVEKVVRLRTQAEVGAWLDAQS